MPAHQSQQQLQLYQVPHCHSSRGLVVVVVVVQLLLELLLLQMGAWGDMAAQQQQQLPSAVMTHLWRTCWP